jgi:(p)ppGpp synthase/HD superfamily hydrolase
MNLLEKAIELAVRAHAGQIDKDDDSMPHVVHCYEVFRRVRGILKECCGSRITLAKYTQEEILASAMLHDTVEDTFVTLDQIEQEFGKNVREIVDSVSRRTVKGEHSHAPEAKESYRDFIYRVNANEGGLIVKIADLSHNRSRATKIKKAGWRSKLEYKYGIALAVLNDPAHPTWEQASASVQYDGQNAHYFIADPNGKKTEVTEAEFKTLTEKA